MDTILGYNWFDALLLQIQLVPANLKITMTIVKPLIISTVPGYPVGFV